MFIISEILECRIDSSYREDLDNLIVIASIQVFFMNRINCLFHISMLNIFHMFIGLILCKMYFNIKLMTFAHFTGQ